MFPVDDINETAYIIFSSSFSEEVIRKELSKRGVSFKVLEGKYKGFKEVSYITKFEDGRYTVDLVRGQESVLVLSPVQDNGLRQALMHYRDHELMENNGIVPIGYFTPVSQEIAEAQDNYTYDPTQNQYFVAM